jgi:hypothetical protein
LRYLSREPKPQVAVGPGLRNVPLILDGQALLILDLVDVQIVCIEGLDRPDEREKFLAAVP